MQMTDKEIVKEFTCSSYRDDTVTMLARINQCPQSEIVKILYDANVLNFDEKHTYGSRGWISYDIKKPEKTSNKQAITTSEVSGKSTDTVPNSSDKSQKPQVKSDADVKNEAALKRLADSIMDAYELERQKLYDQINQLNARNERNMRDIKLLREMLIHNGEEEK